MKLINRVRVL